MGSSIHLIHLSAIVYCYYAENTVERNILDLAARQGVSLYTKENAAGTLDVSSFELDDSQKVIDFPTTKKKGDFIFRCVVFEPLSVHVLIAFLSLGSMTC